MTGSARNWKQENNIQSYNEDALWNDKFPRASLLINGQKKNRNMIDYFNYISKYVKQILVMGHYLFQECVIMLF